MNKSRMVQQGNKCTMSRYGWMHCIVYFASKGGSASAGTWPCQESFVSVACLLETWAPCLARRSPRSWKRSRLEWQSTRWAPVPLSNYARPTSESKAYSRLGPEGSFKATFPNSVTRTRGERQPRRWRRAKASSSDAILQQEPRCTKVRGRGARGGRGKSPAF